MSSEDEKWLDSAPITVYLCTRCDHKMYVNRGTCFTCQSYLDTVTRTVDPTLIPVRVAELPRQKPLSIVAGVGCDAYSLIKAKTTRSNKRN